MNMEIVASQPNTESTPEATPENTGVVVQHDRFRWYAILAQSGMEKKARETLLERIKKYKFDNSFGQIIIPSYTVEKVDAKGKKKQVEQKMMPGYLLVQMDLNGDTYDCVRQTPKILQFIGGSGNQPPPPLGEEEVDRILNRAKHKAKEEAAKPKMNFEKGEKVRVTSGPFANFSGEIDEVKPDKGKLKVLISVFGRQTPVEIEFTKVEKIKS